MQGGVVALLDLMPREMPSFGELIALYLFFHVFINLCILTQRTSMKRMGGGERSPELMFGWQVTEDLCSDLLFSNVSSWSSFFSLALLEMNWKVIRDT